MVVMQYWMVVMRYRLDVMQYHNCIAKSGYCPTTCVNGSIQQRLYDQKFYSSLSITKELPYHKKG